VTIFGVGPLFLACSLTYLGGAYWLTLRWPGAASLAFIPLSLRVGSAVALITCGVCLIAFAAWTMHKAFRAGRLCTTGAFAWCRHPIYGAWTCLVFPGLALLMNSWPALTTPIFMYLCLRLLVRREEDWLNRKFGEEYREYRQRVPAVLPLGRIISLFRRRIH
jgi:protein-S-isoprenylcysteine O-methyltransferase Ste14